jgi:predicted membrane protein
MAVMPRPGDLGWMVLVGAATLVANGTPVQSALVGRALIDALAYNILQFGVPAVLGLRLADALVDARRLPAWAAYTGVVLATVVGGVWVIAPALHPLLGKADWWTWQNDFGLAGTTLIWHALGVAVYAQLRFSRRSEQRLAALQHAAARRERQLAATQLLALQARVDPALLSERLAVIDAELRTDPARAEARLAALIDWLRALQPHVEAEVSTLAREVAALRAYARLVSTDARHTERLHLAGLAEPPDWPLAPMVLLPLVRPLLDDGASLWSLSLHHAGGQAELRLQALGPDPARTGSAAGRVPVDELARRLQAVHGDAAQLRAVAEELPAFRLTWPVPT